MKRFGIVETRVTLSNRRRMTSFVIFDDNVIVYLKVKEMRRI